MAGRRAVKVKAIPERIRRSIFLIRGQKVMLDAHLAELYAVETRALIQAVTRNRTRFPRDFMFQLSKREFANLRSQIVISSLWGGRRSAPYAFTEQGVAMLSSVLNSKRSISVNIEIMRTFVEIRRMVAEHEDLAKRISELEERYDGQFQVVFDAIRSLIAAREKPRKRIGYLSAESARL
ncbi:MAG TPA: ORF6N domain-containing protein [Thermoanaerobaculia bacterium]|nr:ORF6N domain-containing protein [Thermoanaerobaculia bacterium]